MTIQVHRWLGYTLTVFLMNGCGGEGEGTTTPEPTPPWEPATFEGDGLPESEDTQHQTGESGSDGATPPPDTGEEVQPDLIIADGVFSYSVGEKGTTGILILMSVSLSCRDIFGSQSDASPDGLYFSTLIPASPKEPVWPGQYVSCGVPPCYRDGYALVAGEYSPLTEEDWISISSYDVHYLTAEWSSAQTEGSLTFYNCGDSSVWQ